MEKNLYLLKASKLSIKKKDSITNHKDALIAEEQESSKTTVTEALEDSNLITVTLQVYSCRVFNFTKIQVVLRSIINAIAI